jgi:hypothetical protein
MLENPMVKELIKQMDLDVPKPASFEITRYEHVDGVGIVINQIKVLDKNGNYIKFAKLDQVTPYLHKFPCKFKDVRKQDPSEADQEP